MSTVTQIQDLTVVTICTGCMYVVRPGDEDVHRECQDEGGRLVPYVAVHAAAGWLRHIDRLNEIAGADIAMPQYNPLWDAGVALERRFGDGQA
jgi:hypothetical protein